MNIAKEEERKRNIFQAIEDTNVPINFSGRVIDENRDAVEGARVSYSYSVEAGNKNGVPWGEQKIHKSETLTDVTGAFSITGVKAHKLTIESIIKEGYRDNARGARVYDFYGRSPAGKFVSDERNPVLFVITSHTSRQSLIVYRKMFELPGDAAPVRWNLWRAHPDPQGDLQLTLDRQPVVVEWLGQPVRYSAKLEIVNGGGIVEALPEELLFRAPDDGYHSTVEYPQTQQRRGVPERCFYIKTVDGKYGRIEVRLYADDEGKTARCYIRAILNPTGSALLEYDPSATDSPTR